jgi:hypothetical protein
MGNFPYSYDGSYKTTVENTLATNQYCNYDDDDDDDGKGYGSETLQYTNRECQKKSHLHTYCHLKLKNLRDGNS